MGPRPGNVFSTLTIVSVKRAKCVRRGRNKISRPVVTREAGSNEIHGAEFFGTARRGAARVRLHASERAGGRADSRETHLSRNGTFPVALHFQERLRKAKESRKR